MQPKLLAFIGACVLLITACKTEDDFDGPSLNDLYGSFAVVQGLDASTEEVDFSTGETVFFTAQFSKNVNWTLHIKGLESGAVKEITGFSNLLQSDNSLWNGTTSVLPFFKAETCAVSLYVESESDTLRDTVTVLGTRNYPGLLLSDFEGIVNPGWTSFVQSGANMSFGIKDDPAGAAQGNKYFEIAGTVNWDYLIAYLYMPATAYNTSTFSLSTNASDVFFNTMLFKPEELNNGIMLFQFPEDDNGDGVFNAANEDMYAVEIDMTDNGWKPFSIKYSDLQSLVNGQPANPSGNGIKEPHKLKQVNILFLANPSSGYAKARLDFMIFTEGAPLQP